MNKIFIFLLGGAVGSTVTYFLVRESIQKRADEEIESVVQTFKKRFDELNKTPINLQPDCEKEVSDEDEQKNLKEIIDEAVNEYDKQVKDLGYSVGVDLSEDNNYTVNTDNSKEVIAPYIISEEEFGDMGYDEETLIFYEDSILADENDNTIVDIENLVGNTLSNFDDYTETLYVRNEDLQKDYIIIRSEKRYNDIVMEDDN